MAFHRNIGENPNSINSLQRNQALQISNHLKGILITTLGVIILSPDAILMRLLNAETFTVLFWRGVSLSIGITVLMFIMYRRETVKQFLNIGKSGLLIAFMFALSTFCFTTAIQNTSIPNTLVIISTSPIFAALFSWLFLKEKVKLITWIAMLIIIAAIAAIMSSSLGSGSFLGDLSALGSAVFMAVMFTMTRRNKAVNMVPAMAISGIFAALIATLLLTTSRGTFVLAAESVPYLVLGGIFTSIAFALITLGPRYMPAPEVGLIMPLETVLGSYLGWVFLKEEPSMLTLVGGIVVIATLIIHAWLSLKQTQK